MPVLTPTETRALLDRIDTGTVDRAAEPGAAERHGARGERGRRDAAPGLTLGRGLGGGCGCTRRAGSGTTCPAHHRAEEALEVASGEV